MDKPEPAVSRGTLYVVATPIGNPDDITLRALTVLRSVDLIAAEDTREIGKLLAYHGVKGTLVSYHEFNERERSQSLVQRMRQGDTIALVSDAGTPSVSDPGYRLVREALDAGLPVRPIPGVTAATAAISVAGLPTDSFVFVGFLSKKKGKRLEQLAALAAEDKTLVVYESPRRVVRLLDEAVSVLGDRRAVLSREMTKPYEEFLRGRLSDIAGRLKQRDAVKGECTLLVAGREEDAAAPAEPMEDAIVSLLRRGDRKLTDVAKQIAARYACSKKDAYDAALKIKAQLSKETQHE